MHVCQAQNRDTCVQTLVETSSQNDHQASDLKVIARIQRIEVSSEKISSIICFQILLDLIFTQCSDIHKYLKEQFSKKRKFCHYILTLMLSTTFDLFSTVEQKQRYFENCFWPYNENQKNTGPFIFIEQEIKKLNIFFCILQIKVIQVWNE